MMYGKVQNAENYWEWLIVEDKENYTFFFLLFVYYK